jgi:hypothetical protein
MKSQFLKKNELVLLNITSQESSLYANILECKI